MLYDLSGGRQSDGVLAGLPGFDSQQRQEGFLSFASCAMGTGNSPAVKRPAREGDPFPLYSAEIKNGEAVPPLPHTSSWHGT
jgi:hypothetical protein